MVIKYYNKIFIFLTTYLEVDFIKMIIFFVENRLLEGLAIAQSIPFPEDDQPEAPTSLVCFCFTLNHMVLYFKNKRGIDHFESNVKSGNLWK